nr:MAG TPA_asm: Type I restriction enzyme [Caudoviricetes sp.]
MGLAEQESSFNPTAIGVPTKYGRAKGLMQYIDDTASRMGINPYDPVQSIDAAARQLRERLDKGYSMQEAVQAHFGGDDRAQWGPKTAQYGKDVLGRAEKFLGGGQSVAAGQLTQQQEQPQTRMGQIAQDYPPAQSAMENLDQTRQRTQALLDEMNKEEPGRYRPLTDEEMQRLSQHITPEMQQQAMQSGKPIEINIPDLVQPGQAVTAQQSQQQPEKRQAELKPWEPTLWERIKGLIPGNKDAATVEMIARDIANREGVSVEEVYKSMGGARPMWNPEGRAPIQALAEGAGIVGKQLPNVPSAVANASLRAVRGGDISADGSTMMDRVISATNVPQEENQDPNYQSVSGIDQSLGFSLSNMVPSIAAGAAGNVVSPGVGTGAGFATSAAIAYRASKDQFLDDVKKKAETEKGSKLTEKEWETLKDTSEAAAMKYGAWEAIPEALSNVIALKMISHPLVGATRAARIADAAKRLGKEQIAEQVTETATTLGQNEAEREVGLSNEKMSVADAFRQQAIQTALVSGIQGGTMQAGRAIYDRVRGNRAASTEERPTTDPSAQPEATATDPAQEAQPEQAATPTAEQPQEAQPSGPLGRAVQNGTQQVVNDVAAQAEQNTAAAENHTSDEFMGPVGSETTVHPADDPNDSFPAVVQGYRNGNAIVVDENGEILEFGPHEVVRPDAAADVVQQQPEQEVTEPVQQTEKATEEQPRQPKAVSEMTEPELRDRLKYLHQQAKSFGGWNERLTKARREVEKAIDAKNAPVQGEIDTEAVQANGLTPSENRRLKELLNKDSRTQAESAEATRLNEKSRASLTEEVPQSTNENTVGAEGMTLVHGSGNGNLTLDDIQIVRANGQKQGKKGRVYGGFYGTSEKDSAQAEGYAGMMEGTPTVYDVKIKPGTKVFQKEGDITRLSENTINDLVSKGYGVVVGTDPRGRTEYAVIDKNAIQQLSKRGVANAETTNVSDERSAQPEVSQVAQSDNAPAVQPDESGAAAQSERVASNTDQPAAGSGADAISGRTTADTDPSLNKDGSQKWFGTERKANEYLQKKGITGTHEIRLVDRRFEIHAKGQDVNQTTETVNQTADNVKPATKSVKGKNGPRYNRVKKLLGAEEGDIVTPQEDIGYTTAGRQYRIYQIEKNGIVHLTNLETNGGTTVSLADLERANSRRSGFNRVEAVAEPAPAAQEQQQSEPEAEEKTASTQTRSEKNVAATDADRFSGNKLFTADKVAAARARMKSKFGQLNSGLDPELLIDGMTIAGAYIESGVRKFSDYAKSMVDDFGADVKPYLLSFWEGARNYPGLDTEGMTSVEQSAKEHAALMQPEETKTPAVGEVQAKPASRTRKTGKAGDMTITQDWGVEHIDGYGENSSGRETGSDLKDAFLKEARKYLNTVADQLEDAGFKPTTNAKGKFVGAVSVNAGGDAVSGDVNLVMDGPNGIGVYIHIGGTSLRGVVPTTDSGIGIMMRTTTPEDKYGAKSQNLWSQVNISATDMAKQAILLVEKRVAAEQHNRQQNEKSQARVTNGLDDMVSSFDREVTPNESQPLGEPGEGSLETAPADAIRAAESEEPAGQRSPRSSGEDVSGSERAGGSGLQRARSVRDDAGEVPVSTGRGEPAGQRNQSGSSQDAGRNADREQPVRGQRPAAGTVAEDRPARAFNIDADEIGKGGKKTKFRNNVAAIRLLKDLERMNRQATQEEQAILAKYVGWGGIPEAFKRTDGSATSGWAKEVAELDEILQPEEYQAAASSTKNAHYTSPEIVSGMWQAMQRLGFTGGRVLEPSVGVGNFFGLMPSDVRSASALHGVELDRITSGIATQLYPEAKIARMGYQDYVIPNGYFDIAIGNPPFGADKLYDGRRKDLSGFSIHNYFFARTVDALRPGGVMTMVVTNRFMDGASDKARQYIADRADLLGAIRLPNDAFAKNAGTQVTTDIIFLRKRLPDETPSAMNSSWLETVDFTDKNGKVVPLNKYFVMHPENMLGEFGAFGSMYREGDSALIAREGQNTSQLLGEAIQRLPENIIKPVEAVKPESRASVVAENARVGSVFLDGDNVMMRDSDELGESRATAVSFPNEKAKARVVGMIGVRDELAALRKLQLDPKADDAAIESARKRLNRAYDAFVKEHGYLNQDANKRLLRDDPTWPQLAALEDDFDKGLSATVAKKTGEEARQPSAKKAAIFSRRTQSPYTAPTSAATAKDALVTSLAEKGRVDMELMANLYGKEESQIIRELDDLVYSDPEKGWVTREEYLSGNVKTKLARARERAMTDAAFNRNVEALEAVQPKDIEAVDINVKPGATWLPADTMGAFADMIAETSGAKAFYNPVSAKWSFPGLASSAAAQTRYGTDRADVRTILEAAASQKAIQIFDNHRDGTRTLNETETQLANDKVNAVKEAFGRWIWSDDARRQSLARIYNDQFNTDVPREYDGSHLTFPGKISDDIIRLRPHQANAVWRIVQGGTTLADHVVGAGKTFTLIAAAMELRRMGLARKPLFAVPNHLVGQWATDFVKLYPGAKVLAATKRDFEKENRKKLFARISTGDWDAVIVAHSSFGKVQVDPEHEAEFIREQIDDLTSSIEAIREAEGQSSRNVKDAAKRRDALKERLKKLVDSENKDDSLYWSELGVDALFVDEAHEFKNLAYSTSMRNVAGLGDASGSQRAMDMFMKVRHVLKATGGRNVVFATGTPISNTMAEMYTMQRYMDYDNLKAQGLSHFDAWARMFGEVVTDWELSPSGKYKMTARFAKFVNMPELMQRYTSFADVINRDDINRQLAAQGKKLPVPKMKGGKPTNIVVPRSSMQATYIGEPITDNNGIEQYPQGSLVYRAEHLPKKAEKGADNMLKIMSDARKVALDMRLIEPGAPDFERSKTNEAARRIKEDYDKWADDRGAQLVFIDLSTPKNAKTAEAARIRDLVEKAEQGDEAAAEQLDKLSPDELAALDGEFSVYDDLKQKLVALGIPENEIAFIHDAKTELQKEELFGKVRSGRVRVLLGSTSKMGAGMNVQDRLVALHHLDAPWRPSDLEQREGRIIRQGNKLYDRDPEGFEVGVYRYATKQTLDSRMWQTLEAKARFIEQVRKGNTAQREVEDIGGEAANAAEMKAASSGNPLILEEMTLRQKMRRLENERAGFDRDQYRIRDTIQQQRRKAEWMAKSLDELRQDVNLSVPDKFAMTINGQELEKRKDAGEALLSIAADMEHNHSDERQIGQYGDFPMSMERTSAEQFTINLEGAGSYTVNFGIGADPLGLTMRISNAVKDLGDAITVMEQGREKALAEIPKLQEQLAEWPKAQELKDTRKRHAEVVDQLKPKKAEKPAESVAAPATQEPKPQYSVATNRAVRGALARGDAGALVAKLQKDGRIVIHDTPPENRRADAAGWVDPDGSIHLALSNLTAETAQPVLMHELFHSGMNAISGSPRWNNLISRLNEYVEAASRREGRETAWDRAYTRIEQSEEGSRRAEELGAYAVEHFEQMPPGIRKWAETVIGTVKNWVQQRFGVQLGEVTPSQLRALAAGAVRNQSPVKGATETAYSMKPGEAKKEAEAFYGKKIDATRDLTGDALTAAMPTLLHWTPGRFLLKRVAKDIPALGEYADIKLKMDTFRDEWHALTDKLAQRWQKYRAKNAAENSQLMQIMHESTLAQADPSEKFESRLNGADLKILRNKKTSSDEWQQANKKAMDESAREKEWTRLNAEFQKLSPEGQALYRDVRDLYSKLANTQEAIIVANLEKAMEFRIKEAQREFEDEMQAINDEGLKGEDREKAITAAKKKLDNARRRDAWNRRARVNQLRQEFESNRLAGPYFPLARFGDYFVTARNKKTNEIEVFSRQETPFQQSRVAKELRKQGFEVETGLISKTAELRKQVPAEFVARIEDILKGLPAAKETQDQVWQLYLERMPDMSLRKNRIHRKGRAGFEEDALRAFASHMFHGAHQTARMKFAMDLQDQLDEAKRQTKYTRNPTRSGLVLEQAEKNHQYVMNPTSNRIAQVATQGAFMWYLAQSPAAALVNMGQTVIVAPSKLAAFYDKGTARGMAVALGQINKAMFDLANGRTFAEQSRRVTPQEKAAVSEAYRIGLITRTQSHDVAGIADSGIKYRPTRARIMAAMSFMFHHTERINREATFLAAYRIARKRGLDHQNAIRKASELTWDSHYDYQNSSRPAVMHSNTGKALLVFRNYSLNMISDLAYTTYEIINPRNAQERREARTQMIGLLGSLAFNTGIRGLPLFGMLMVIAGMFSDDGEDPEVELKKTLLQYLPPSMVGIMMDGVPGYAFGVELSGRIGFGDLWFRSDDMDREGDSAYLYWLQQLLGPASSIPYTAVRGISQIQDGYTWRGMENLVPKAIRDPMKAYRYYSEGVTTKNGDPIVDEVGGWDVLKQAMGFTPARVTEQYKLNSYNMNKQKTITEERSKLLGDFYKAWKAGDEKKVDQITDKMRAYSEKYPEMRIDGDAVRSSLSRREKYRGQALGGMNYNQKLIPRLQEEQPGKVYR